MAFAGDPASQFGDSNQVFGYMTIFKTIYFVHIETST